MSTIKVSCTDQVLAMTNTPVIASGGIMEDYVSFQFCPLWDGYYKTAVFWRSKDQAYHVILDDTNTAQIPNEVLAEDGVVYFGVFGVNDAGVQRTSAVLRYTIVEGAITEGTEPPEPTPDIYQQILTALAAMGDNSGKADKVSNATTGNFAALDANGNLADSGKKAGDFAEISAYDPTIAVSEAGGIAAYVSGQINEALDEGTAKSVAVTLTASGWSSLEQTVTVPGVLADESAQLIQLVPALSAQTTYMDAGIRCTAQAANSLTFAADTAPAADILLYVVMQGVRV